MDSGTRVRIVEPAPGYYIQQNCHRKIPNVFLLGQAGEIVEPVINRFGELVYEVHLDSGQNIQCYEGELKALPGPETVEGGTRAMPSWANNPEELESMLNCVRFLDANFEETFTGIFPNEQSVVARIEELRGVDFNGNEEQLPPI